MVISFLRWRTPHMPQKKVQRHRLVLVIGRDDTKAGLTAATALPLCGSSMMFVAIRPGSAVRHLDHIDE